MDMNCLGLPREGERPGTWYAFLGFRIVYVGAKQRKAKQSNVKRRIKSNASQHLSPLNSSCAAKPGAYLRSASKPNVSSI